jgi:hypothetical protein
MSNVTNGTSGDDGNESQISDSMWASYMHYAQQAEDGSPDAAWMAASLARAMMAVADGTAI